MNPCEKVDLESSRFKKLYEDLRDSINGVSVLGNFLEPLIKLHELVNDPVAANALVNHEFWIPKGAHVNGRDVEVTSILGPFFHVSALPDDHPDFRASPDVGQTCFSICRPHHSTEVADAFKTINSVVCTLYNGLKQVLHCLLKNAATKEHVLAYLAEVINRNSGRAQMQVDSKTCSSSGMFMNLSAVMLRLCQPFLDEKLSKRDKIDPKYVTRNIRVDFKGLTTLNASSSEVFEWFGKNNDGEEAAFSFICECFFMTARILHLGLMKGISELQHLEQEIENCEETLSDLRSTQQLLWHNPESELNEEIVHFEQELESMSQTKLCYEALILADISDEGLIRRALSFYRLMVVWLVGLVGSSPKELASLPENFVEDVMDLLLFLSAKQKYFNGILLDDFMNFIITFMAAPEYVRNPYLRAKMVDVLYSWIPCKCCSSSQTCFSSLTTNLFKSDSSMFLVRNLLKVYVDVEFTTSHSEHYEKFGIRHTISALLEYLWQIPSHRDSWIKVAKDEEKGIYLNFLNFLTSDSTYLLDESLTKILELKGMQNNVSWKLEAALKLCMKSAVEGMRMLEYTSQQITAPFLIPEIVERVASMLNYFLLKLVGPQSKNLTLENPEKYEFDPKLLVTLIVKIYVNLSRGDEANAFAAAIAKDGRSCNEKLFNDTLSVLQKIGADKSLVKEFSELGNKTKVAADMEMEMEAVLGDIPDEFQDPIQYTLMHDPVILPTSRITVDRSVIKRHLLSNNFDPFSRSYLTIDRVKPNIVLKGRIDEFIKSKKLNQDGDQYSS